jgi:hypothetical protein
MPWITRGEERSQTRAAVYCQWGPNFFQFGYLLYVGRAATRAQPCLWGGLNQYRTFWRYEMKSFDRPMTCPESGDPRGPPSAADEVIICGTTFCCGVILIRSNPRLDTYSHDLSGLSKRLEAPTFPSQRLAVQAPPLPTGKKPKRCPVTVIL